MPNDPCTVATSSTYFWKCCDIKEPARSWEDAQQLLEAHEAKKHKGRPIGSFGWERITCNNSKEAT